MKLWMETPRLTDGVSQQPDSRRFRSQAETATNTGMYLIDGLDKRTGTEYVAEVISGGVHETYWNHWIERGDGEEYVLIGTQPTVGGVAIMRAFDANNGSEIHIEDQASAAAGGTLGIGSGTTAPTFDYLDNLSNFGKEYLRALTIADHTILVNKQKTPAMDTAHATTDPNDGYVFVRVGAYKQDYTVRIKAGGGFYSVTTQTWSGNGAAGGEISSIKTNDIADDLVTQINNIVGTPVTASNTTPSGSVIKIVSNSQTLQGIEVFDGVGDSSMEALYQEVDTFVELPLVCTDGFKLKVTGDPTIGGDDYYIKFVADDGAGSFGAGVWEQTIGHGQEYQYDDTTMPVILVRRQNPGPGALALASGYSVSSGETYFTLEKPDWGDRTVGDETINPDPSFIGQSIENVFLFKNRLGFLAEDNVIMSEVNGFFNFFRTDLTNLLDSDPVDIAISHPDVTLAEQAAGFEDDLILFTESGFSRVK